MKTLPSGLLVVAATFVVLPASAEVIDVKFTGDVVQVDGVLQGDIVSVGDPMTLTYTYESTTADSNPGDPERGDYLAATIWTLSVGANTWTTAAPENRISIFYYPNDHRYILVLSLSGPQVAGYQPSRIQVILRDASGTALSSDALPTIAPDLSKLSLLQARVAFLPNDKGFGLSLDSSTLVGQVPAASNRSLFVMGLLFAAALSIFGLRYVRRSVTA